MTAKSVIRRESERDRHDRGGGASTVQMVTPGADAANIINGYTDIPPGGGIPLHYHNCEESVLVVDGSAIVEIDGEAHDVAVTDVVWIAAGVPHRFSNPSDTDRLRIFWTYASSTATRTLVATGEKRPIVSEHGPAG